MGAVPRVGRLRCEDVNVAIVITNVCNDNRSGSANSDARCILEGDALRNRCNETAGQNRTDRRARDYHRSSSVNGEAPRKLKEGVAAEAIGVFSRFARIACNGLNESAR